MRDGHLMSGPVYHLFRCPTHGVLSEREGDEVYEGHDGTMFGRTPDGDPYTGKFYCGIYNHRAKSECLEPLDEVTLVEAGS